MKRVHQVFCVGSSVPSLAPRFGFVVRQVFVC